MVGLRYTKPLASYSCARDRGILRATVIKAKSQQDKSDLPVIATMITQYGIGKPVHCNDYAKNTILYSRDTDHVNQLSNDTIDQRITFFKSSLNMLKHQLNCSEFKHIEFVMFPLGIGRSGFIDDIWLTHYLSALFTFSNDLNGRTVCLVVREELFSILEDICKRNNNLDSLFIQVKQLEILQDFTNSSKADALTEFLQLSNYDIDSTSIDTTPIETLYNPTVHRYKPY